MKQIGIFGGTFDPIHLGHLHAARRVKEKCAFDGLILIPAAIPPHKCRRDMASPEQRFEMVKLAVAQLQDVEVSPIEIRRQGPSYTIDTVTSLIENGDGEKSFFLVMGVDAFQEIETWKSYRTLLGRIPVVVISRLTEGLAGKRFLQDTVEATLHQHISADYHFLEAKTAFVHPEFQPVHICHVNPLDISSTDIRNRIRAGCSVDGMVPANVLQYIDRWELYR